MRQKYFLLKKHTDYKNNAKNQQMGSLNFTQNV